MALQLDLYLYRQSMHVVAVGEMACAWNHILCLCTESTNKTQSLLAFPRCGLSDFLKESHP